MVISELEALSMTLTESELQVKGSTADTSLELKLSRRPSKQEWKDCNIQFLIINVVPQLSDQKPIDLIVSSKKDKEMTKIRVNQLPLVTLQIEITSQYPSNRPPVLRIEGFY